MDPHAHDKHKSKQKTTKANRLLIPFPLHPWVSRWKDCNMVQFADLAEPQALVHGIHLHTPLQVSFAKQRVPVFKSGAGVSKVLFEPPVAVLSGDGAESKNCLVAFDKKTRMSARPVHPNGWLPAQAFPCLAELLHRAPVLSELHRG